MATNPVSMPPNLSASNTEQQVTSASQEAVFSSSSCHETIVTSNTLTGMSPGTGSSQRSDLNPLRNSSTVRQSSPKHCINLGETAPTLEQIQHRVDHMLCSSELSFEQGCGIHPEVSSDPITSKALHHNFRSVTSLADASVNYSLESLNKEDAPEVTNTPPRNMPDLTANSQTSTNELTFFSNINQHVTSLKCITESTFRTFPGKLTAQYSFNKNDSNNNDGETIVPTISDNDNVQSCPASLSRSKRLWNFGCSHKKSDVICDTVDAWCNTRSGKLFFNLKQSLFGHMNRTERMLLIGGSKPLVFGGTYPIDVPLEINVEETVSNSDKDVYSQTYDIDTPCLGFWKQTLASSSVDSQNTVVRRNKTVSEQCPILGSSPELKH